MLIADHEHVKLFENEIEYVYVTKFDEIWWNMFRTGIFIYLFARTFVKMQNNMTLKNRRENIQTRQYEKRTENNVLLVTFENQQRVMLQALNKPDHRQEETSKTVKLSVLGYRVASVLIRWTPLPNPP